MAKQVGYSKDDFGYYFAENGNEERVPFNPATADQATEVVVPLDDNGIVNEARVADPVAARELISHKGKSYAFAKGEIEEHLYTPVKTLSDKEQNKQTLETSVFCCSLCCCLSLIGFIIGGSFLVAYAAYRDEFFSDRSDDYLVVGSTFMIAGGAACLAGCLSCCVGCFRSCCMDNTVDSKGKVELRPNKKYEIKLERWNDQFKRIDEGLSKLREQEFKKVLGSVKSFKKVNKEIKKVKKSIKDERISGEAKKITDYLDLGYSPDLVRKTLQPTCFRIEFNGDMMVSEMDIFRDQVSSVIRLADKDMDMVIVVISSPGGAVTQYGLASSQLVRIKNAGIKLIVCIDSIAASGGYMMASVADEIFAAPFALVGSIGVISIIPNIEGMLNKWNIHTNVLTSGEYKNTVNVVGEVTEEGRKKYMEELEVIHEAFKHHIVLNRPRLADNMSEIATGEAFLAVEARRLGLVDHIMTSDELIASKYETHEVINVTFKHNSDLPPFFAAFSNSASYSGMLHKLLPWNKLGNDVLPNSQKKKLVKSQSPEHYLV